MIINYKLEQLAARTSHQTACKYWRKPVGNRLAKPAVAVLRRGQWRWSPSFAVPLRRSPTRLFAQSWMHSPFASDQNFVSFATFSKFTKSRPLGRHAYTPLSFAILSEFRVCTVAVATQRLNHSHLHISIRYILSRTINLFVQLEWVTDCYCFR